MTKDQRTVILGIIYSSLAVIFIILGFTNRGGGIGPTIAAFGIFCLIPSVIFYLVFCLSTEGVTSAGVGFGLGIPAWALGLLGVILNWGFGYFYAIDIGNFIIFIGLLVTGTLLFLRRTLSITPPPTCPDCNRRVRFITQYNKYYCDQCKKYMDIISR